jgi:hypothetical protein
MQNKYSILGTFGNEPNRPARLLAGDLHVIHVNSRESVFEKNSALCWDGKSVATLPNLGRKSTEPKSALREGWRKTKGVGSGV